MVRKETIDYVRRTAGGALIQEGKILLGLRSSERNYYPDVWDVFGGHLEEEESPDAALARELKEELGITQPKFEQIAIFNEPRVLEYGYAENHIYAVTSWLGKPTKLGNEHSEIGWFTPEAMGRLSLASALYLQLFTKYLERDIHSRKIRTVRA